MGKQLYQVCEKCGRELPRTREYFKRKINKETNKEEYVSYCRECELLMIVDENWKDGKLKCFICGEWLDPENFDFHEQYKHRNHKDKRCKKCKRKQNVEARLKYDDNKKLYKILQERWLGARSRANTKNIPFTITKEDLIDLWESQNGKCAISNIPMTFEMDNGRVFSNVSIDQISAGLGYTKDNVQLICQAVNLLKSDWDINTVVYICKSIVDNHYR